MCTNLKQSGAELANFELDFNSRRIGAERVLHSLYRIVVLFVNDGNERRRIKYINPNTEEGSRIYSSSLELAIQFTSSMYPRDEMSTDREDEVIVFKS
ncbi:7651_t:CDS:2 [Funneliformis geosporum]|nr:7651_t:CDS:2 [Funneliformis geosporum]